MAHGADQSEVFYFTDGLETFGPFDRSTMLKRAAERLITEETLIFVEGTTEWTPFGRSGLAGADEKPPPTHCLQALHLRETSLLECLPRRQCMRGRQ
jgi:hypothetical protein